MVEASPPNSEYGVLCSPLKAHRLRRFRGAIGEFLSHGQRWLKRKRLDPRKLRYRRVHAVAGKT